MSAPKTMQACEDCGLLFRDSRGVSEHMATNHQPDRDYDQPDYWDAEDLLRGNPRLSVRKKQVVLRVEDGRYTEVDGEPLGF